MRPTTRYATVPLSCALLLAALSACSQPQPAAPAPAVQPAPAAIVPAASTHNFAKWEKDIAAYEAKDQATPPPKGGILFIGSSTIRRWATLAVDFPEHQVINRGFGGSQIVDATHFAKRIVFPYEPRMIVLRSGGNDIHAGKSPEQVFEDYKAFVAAVRERLPSAPIVYLSVTPTPSRWAEREPCRVLDGLIEGYTHQRPNLIYVETNDMVLGPDGRPRPELFVADRLHLSPEGYRLLADRVRPVLPK